MLVLGIDCSTTASKAIAWDAQGSAVAEGRAAFALENPEPDGWEQDAESWWTATSAAVRACVKALGARAREVSGLCVTHQRETFVVTDERGHPLHKALVWMDARGRRQVAGAVARLGEETLHTLSGKPPCVTPSLYKALWLFEREPALRAARPVLLDVHAFLAWRLTGRRATSLAAADPLGLVDMKERRWSEELVGLLGLDVARLPELVEPGAELGRLTDTAASALALASGLPVIAGAGDGQCAGLGAGIVAPGRAYLNLGTAVVSGVLSHDYVVDPAFRTLYGASPGSFFLETDLKGGTFTLNWLAEKWAGRAASADSTMSRTADTPSGADATRVLDELERASTDLPPGAGGLMLVPYWNGVMNPYWDDDATGIMVGLTGSHEPRHLYRAILEGIAFEQRLHTSGVENATGREVEEMVLMGGGARSEAWCQILADVLGKRMLRARSSEATALGAGILAATGVGLHPTLDVAVTEMTGLGERFEPGAARAKYDTLYRDVYEKLYPALREPLARLTALTR